MTIPAGTPQDAPYTQAIDFPPRDVVGVRIRVPPGPRGVMGFALTMGGNPVLPTQLGTYVVTDDETIVWDLSDQPDSGAWEVTGYNTGQYHHTIYVTFLLDYVTSRSPVASGPVSLG